MSEKDNSVPPLSFEIERQARIKRSLVIQSCVRGTMRAFAEWFCTFVLRSTQLARGLTTPESSLLRADEVIDHLSCCGA
jgi:hypothetical protein